MNTKQRMQLVINTGISLATVIKWDKGKEVTEANDKALRNETKSLGFTREIEVSNSGKVVQ